MLPSVVSCILLYMSCQIKTFELPHFNKEPSLEVCSWVMVALIDMGGCFMTGS